MPAIAPYGVFKTRDGADILIAIQNDREWRVLAEKVLGDAALGGDARFATNPQRVKHRARNRRAWSPRVFAAQDVEPLDAKTGAAPRSALRASTTGRCCRSIRTCGASRSMRRAARCQPAGAGAMSGPARRAATARSLRWASIRTRSGRSSGA